MAVDLELLLLSDFVDDVDAKAAAELDASLPLVFLPLS